MRLFKSVVLRYKKNKKFLDRTHLNDVDLLEKMANEEFMKADSIKFVSREESIDLVKKSIKKIQRLKVLSKNLDLNKLDFDLLLKKYDKMIDERQEFLLNFSENELIDTLSSNYADKYYNSAKEKYDKAVVLKFRKIDMAKEYIYDALLDIDKAIEFYKSENNVDNVLKVDMSLVLKKDIVKLNNFFLGLDK
jgi:tetratricopeptide (TPR) repeat protein